MSRVSRRNVVQVTIVARLTNSNRSLGNFDYEQTNADREAIKDYLLDIKLPLLVSVRKNAGVVAWGAIK